MRTLHRIAFLAVFGSVAVPASAQHAGSCPPVSGLAAVTITESSSALFPRSGSPTEALECLFSSDGRVRAALYPSGPQEWSPHVRIFDSAAEYGSSGGQQAGQKIEVSRGSSRFSDLDRATLERVEEAAGLHQRTPDVAAPKSPPSDFPHDPGPFRRASYNPTTPATQGSSTSLRVTSLTYDKLDRLETETVQLEDGSTRTISYTYWNSGKRKTVTDAVGRVTFYEYNGLHLLSRLTANQGLPDEQVTTYDYWGDGLLKTVTKPDGTITSYDYDGGDRLKSVVVQKDGTVLLSYAYTSDDNGNRTRQIEVNGGPPETTTYTYDDLNRLETVSYPDGRSVVYGYDLVGNRTAETERNPAGAVVSHKTAIFDAANRLSTVTDIVDPSNNATFAYDRNGNLTTKTTAAGIATYLHDPHDQLVETRQGEQVTARFAYDGFGRRYLKIGDEGIRQYLYDQTSLLEEFTEQNVEVAKYEWGGDRLVSLFRHDELRRYFHLDGLGSVAMLTEESGGAAARYHYDAWGRHRDLAELDVSANRFGFTGHYFDTETKLYFAKARYYDPDYGRFLSQDSYLGQVDNPPSLHRYFYANDNPTTYVDPTGHIARQILDESINRSTNESNWFTAGATAFLKEASYQTLDVMSFGALHRQDKLVDKNLAGEISDAEYYTKTGDNVALSGTQAALTLGSGGTLGATRSAAVAWGAAGGIAAQGISDLGEIYGTQTKTLDDVRARDYRFAGALGAVSGYAGYKPGGPTRAGPSQGEKAGLIAERGQSLTPDTPAPAAAIASTADVNVQPAIKSAAASVPAGAPNAAASALETFPAGRSLDLTGKSVGFGSGAHPSGRGYVYALRDQVSGEILKVGKTTGGQNIYRRFNWYRRKSQEFGVKVEAEYWEVADAKKALTLESEIRTHLESQGFTLPWDKVTQSNRGVPWRGLPWQRGADTPIPGEN